MTDVFALTTISLTVMVADNVLLTVKPMLKRLHVFVITPTIFITSVIMLAKHAHQDNSQMLPEQNVFAHKIQSIRMEFVYQIALERRFMLKTAANVSVHLTTFFLEIFVLKGVDLTKNSIAKVKSVIVSLDMLSLMVVVNNAQPEKVLSVKIKVGVSAIKQDKYSTPPDLSVNPVQLILHLILAKPNVSVILVISKRLESVKDKLDAPQELNSMSKP